jgi:hypothetical protein
VGFTPEGSVSKDTRVQVALTNWGGLVTEVTPTNCPEGASPDNQECAFVPGKLQSRPGFKRVFDDPVGTVTFTYGKTYIDPINVVRNLYLASDGTLYLENGSGPPTVLGATTPGSFAKSTTAFGREYIAISDGLHGQEVPLQYDGTNLDRVTQDGPGAPPTIVSTPLPPVNLAQLAGIYQSRMNNVVTAHTASAHGLKVGYLAQILGVTPAPIAVIDTLVIDNDNNPGVATITVTPAASPVVTDIQFTPEQFVIIIAPTPHIQANITSLNRQGGIVTVETATAHLLQTGAMITIDGTGDATVDGMIFGVTSTSGPQTFTFLQSDADLTLGAAGTVAINWPFASQQFEVVAAPGPNQFQINVAYSNGTWTTGEVHFPWDGTFYVTSVPNSTTFTYQQYGPDDLNTLYPGTVTPKGQAAPGKHQMQVLYLTRQGYTTKPSPPVKFIANGDQYLDVSNIPLGPPNVVARILAFTGADGSEFFYIPVPAQVNGQVVSTATQINDNTTTSVRLDFGDPTLFAGLDIGPNVIGNDLPSQRIMDSAIGFGFYGSRLITYGQRNNIQNFQGMSFDSGAFPSNPTLPTGWTASGSGAGGALAAGHFGRGWQFSSGGGIFQTAYLDYGGGQIVTPNTKYRFRAWFKGLGATATLTISSASTGFSSTATIISNNASGSWLEAAFSLKMPAAIPIDMTLTLSGTGGGLIDEMSVIFADNPYLDKVLFGSYVDNPEGFDGVSGEFGPTDDTHKIMNIAVIRSTLYLLTRDPAGRLHSTVNNGTTEPAGWTTNEVATMCGSLSTFGLTVSQADDDTGAGGEQWMAWASQSGVRIFGGDQPWKISQEIQTPGINQPGWTDIVLDAALSIWALNDPSRRRMYFGLPFGEAGSPANPASAPTDIYVLDYTDLDTAWEIAQASPYRSGGRDMQAPYTSRKWTIWHRPMNSAAIMERSGGGLSPETENLQVPVFMGGNGQSPNFVPGFGNCYTLASQCSDDDYGQFFPYYTTYFFVNHALEAALGLGGQRKLLQFLQFVAQIPEESTTTTGHVIVTIFCNSLRNPWPIAFPRDLKHDQDFDIETPGGNAEAQRFAIQFAWFPGAS